MQSLYCLKCQNIYFISLNKAPKVPLRQVTPTAANFDVGKRHTAVYLNGKRQKMSKAVCQN